MREKAPDHRKGTGSSDPASGTINSIAGALSIAGFVILIIRAAGSGSTTKPGAAFIVGVSIYGACVIYRFVIAAVAAFAGRRGALKSLEESGTFFLPAGVLMPIVFSFLEGAWRWTLFGLAWAYATAGFVLGLALVGDFRRYAISFGYLLFFVLVPLLSPIRAALGAHAFAWLFSGGMFYLIALLDRKSVV